MDSFQQEAIQQSTKLAENEKTLQEKQV